MFKKFLLFVALAGILSASSSAFACDFEAAPKLSIDTTLPAIVFEEFDVKIAQIKRGEDSGNSCDDLGWVTLEIIDVDPEVGYTVALTDGSPPKDFGEYLAPVIPDEDGKLVLVWSEAVSEDQPPVNFTLRVTAIAPNGDAGPSHDVVVSHSGMDGGCSAAGHQDAGLMGLAVFGLLFQWRRKK